MASCECCWSEARSLGAHGVGHTVDLYDMALVRHKEQGCVCVQDTLDGAKARAGMFWDPNVGRDTRETAETQHALDKMRGGGDDSTQ